MSENIQQKRKKLKERLIKEQETVLHSNGIDNSKERDQLRQYDKYIPLPIAWFMSKIPKPHMGILTILNQYENPGTGCILSNSKLAELAGKSVKTIEIILRELEENQLIILRKKQSKYRQIFINHSWEVEKKIDFIRKYNKNNNLDDKKNKTLKNIGSTPRFYNPNNTSYYKAYKTASGEAGAKNTIFIRNDGKGRKPETPNLEKSKTSKQEKTKTPSQKLHPIVEYWNSLKSTRKHTNPQTKVYRDSVRRINQLQNGKFCFANKSLKNFCQTRNLPVSLVRKKWTEKEIREVLQDISSLNGKKYALNEVLCCPHHPTGLVSLFLLVASGRAESMREIEDPNPEITNYLRQIMSDKSPGKSELQRLYKITNEIMKYQKWIYDYCKSHDDSKGGEDRLIRFFASEMKDPVFITKVYVDWWEEKFEEIEDWTITTNALGPKSKTWNLFIDDWIKDIHPNRDIQIRGYDG